MTKVMKIVKGDKKVKEEMVIEFNKYKNLNLSTQEKIGEQLTLDNIAYRNAVKIMAEEIDDLDVELEVIKEKYGEVDEEELLRRKKEKLETENLPIGLRTAKRTERRMKLQLEYSKKVWKYKLL